MKIILLTFLLFSCCMHTVVSQTKGAVSSVVVSGTSSWEVKSQLKNAAKDALDALEANPNDLDNVMKQLANVLLTEIGEIVTALLNGTVIDPEVVSVDISDTVGNAVSVAASSGEKFQGLEVDSITQEIRTNVAKILSNLDVDANVSVVTSDVANVVLLAIGNALSDITGTNFTFKIRVEATAEAIEENFNLKYNSTDDVLIVLDKELQKLIKSSLFSLQKNPERLNTEFSTLAAELVSLIGQIFNYLLQEGELEAGQEIMPRVIFSVTQVLNEVQQNVGFFEGISAENIAQDIQSALQNSLGKFQKNHNVNEFVVNLVHTILTPIGEALSDLVNVEFTLKIDASVNSQYTSNSQATAKGEDEELNNDVQLEASIEILQSMGTTKKAFNLIKIAAEKGQNIAIAASFLQAITQAFNKEFDKILDLFFNDESIPTDTLVFVTTLTTVQGGEEAIDIFIKKMQQNKQSQQLSRAFSYAFTTFDRSVTDAFLTLIQKSAKNGKCGLKELVDGMFDYIPKFNHQNVLILLEESGVGNCVSQNLNASSNQTYEWEISAGENVTTNLTSGSHIGSSQGEISVSELEELITETIEALLNEPINEELSQESDQSSPKNTTPSTTTEFVDDDCFDIVPPSKFSCAEQKKYGKCTSGWMIAGGFCKRTCGTCNNTLSIPTPTPIPSPTSYPPSPFSYPSYNNDSNFFNHTDIINETTSSQTLFEPVQENIPAYIPIPSPKTEYSSTPTPSPSTKRMFTPISEPITTPSPLPAFIPAPVLELPVRVHFSPVEQHKAGNVQTEESKMGEQSQCCNNCLGFDIEQLKQIIKNEVLEALSEAFGEIRK